MPIYPSVSSQTTQALWLDEALACPFELVSPSGREQQQGLGPGTRALSLGGLPQRTSGVPPPGLSQKKMQLQQHMSIPTKVGVGVFY